jgi:hypothetical protein
MCQSQSELPIDASTLILISFNSNVSLYLKHRRLVSREIIHWFSSARSFETRMSNSINVHLVQAQNLYLELYSSSSSSGSAESRWLLLVGLNLEKTWSRGSCWQLQVCRVSLEPMTISGINLSFLASGENIDIVA